MQSKLLVSVRNQTEAIAAIQGGADIVDLKEPENGPLGMAELKVIADVNNWIQQNSPSTAISAALGELAEWADKDASGVPCDLQYLKVGLAGEAENDFSDRMKRLREMGPVDQSWITVAYADCEAAGSPPVETLVKLAIESTSAGFLLDTYGKSGHSLTDFVPVKKLIQIRERLSKHGLMFAIAGQLKIEQIPTYRQAIQPDVIAVRSAACHGQDRGNQISVDAVAKLKAAVELASVV